MQSTEVYSGTALRWYYGLLLLLATGLACNKSNRVDSASQTTSGTTFTNPLLPSGPDPYVFQMDQYYFYTHTLGNRIAIWKTEKMSSLKMITSQTIWTAPAVGPNAKNVWAPEIHFLDNKWYTYYTAGSTSSFSTQRLFVLENSNTDPTQGPWMDKGQIGDSSANIFAIDGTVLTYDSKYYLIWSGHETAADSTQHLFIAQMKNPWTLSTARQKISSPTYEWERQGAPPAVNEGPAILKGPTGKLFLVFSASGCWTDEYTLGLLTLREGGNPLVASDWTKSPTPVFVKNPAEGAYGPGHCSFFKTKDDKEDWMLYHANSSAGQGCGDTRNPRMQRFTWNADGSPNFGAPISIFKPIQKPSGE